jgi:hypothetical protein
LFHKPLFPGNAENPTGRLEDARFFMGASKSNLLKRATELTFAKDLSPETDL